MVSKVAIGSFISVCDNRNKLQKDLPVYGINKEKEFMPTVANMTDVDTSKYKILTKDIFAFNGMHVGRDVAVPIGKYNFDFDALISPAYTTFTIDESKGILKEYFEVFIRLNEFDRLGWFYCDSSVRGGLEWKRFLDIEIPLPSKEDQQKVVNVWKAFREIKEQNEAKAAPLMQLCQSYIQELKHKYPTQEIGPHLQFFREKNKDKGISLEQGINISKEFITPQRSNSDLSSRIKVRTGQFAYCTQLNNENVAIAYRTGPDCVVSPVYEVFEIKEERREKLLPEYLFIWLSRPEFGRYVYWSSVGSAYEFLRFDNLYSYKIAFPPLDVQRSIVNIYKCANEAKQIAAEADRLSREVCPALLQHIIKS